MVLLLLVLLVKCMGLLEVHFGYVYFKKKYSQAQEAWHVNNDTIGTLNHLVFGCFLGTTSYVILGAITWPCFF